MPEKLLEDPLEQFKLWYEEAIDNLIPQKKPKKKITSTRAGGRVVVGVIELFGLVALSILEFATRTRSIMIGGALCMG